MLLAKAETSAEAVVFHLESLPPLESLERLWSGLDRVGAHSFFVSWNWIGPFLRCTGGNAMLLRAVRGEMLAGLAVVSAASGRIRRLFPVRRSFLNARGDPEIDGIMVEHNGFAVPHGSGEYLLCALAEWFRGGGISADELVLPGISAPGVTRDRWVTEWRREAYRTPLRTMSEAGIVSLLSRNARQQLRRSVRDYGDVLALDRAATADIAFTYFDELKRLHVKSWERRGRNHAFDNPFFERFHRAVIEQGVAEGAVDLLRVRAGSAVLGYLYNFVRNGIVSSYQSGFADDEPGLRPGYVCHALAIDHYAEKGMHCYDFLAGTNRLKESFGVETYELSWLQVRKPMIAFRFDSLIRKAGAFIPRHKAGRAAKL